jgi:hypothetical protein
MPVHCRRAPPGGLGERLVQDEMATRDSKLEVACSLSFWSTVILTAREPVVCEGA